MAAGNYPLRLLQVGKETSPGTLIAATHKLIGQAVYTPDRKAYIPKYPLGVRAPFSSGGIALTKTSALNVTTDLTYEEILDVFQTGLIAVATPTGGPAANDVWTIATTGNPTGGTFTLTVTVNAGTPQTTASIAYNAGAAAIQSAIAALSNVGAGNVACTGGPLPTSVTATFQGALANTPVTITHTDTLTGGTSPAVTLTHTTTGSAGYTWTFAPNLTGAPNVASLTAEYVVRDGTNNWYAKRFGYGTTEEFDIDLAFGQQAKLTYKMFGRAEQEMATPGVFTPGLSAVAGREIASSMSAKVYIDNAWSGLGGTQIVGSVRSLKLAFKTGFAPDYTLDGRPDLDMTNMIWGEPSFKLSLVMEHDGNAQSELSHWRPNAPDLRFVRVAIPGAASPNKLVRLDMAGRYFTAPKFSEQNNVELVTLELEGDYDQSSGNFFTATVVNGLSTWT
jgi:hypothetical protein